MVAVPTLDPVASAKEAGLRYVSDAMPGIRRRRAGKGFIYTDEHGRTIRDEATLRRIKALAIPPAWTEVWICPIAHGHIQASGRDAKRRKQYRYHARWREVRDETKYGRMIAFAHALPEIRAAVERDLRKPGLTREKVLATVVRLLEVSLIRVGNDEYATKNHSYGLTTLKDHHVAIDGGSVRFHFRGKSGKQHSVTITDRRLARIVRACQEIPGQELFQWLDDEGGRHSIDSSDVNAYIREIGGDEFTAKDFRTWAGTVLAAAALEALAATGQKPTKKSVVRAVESVAGTLGNTPAVCRKCYIHPAIIETYLSGDALRTSGGEEAAVLALLERRVKQAANDTLEKRLERSLRAAAARRARGPARSSTRATRSRPGSRGRAGRAR